MDMRQIRQVLQRGEQAHETPAELDRPGDEQPGSRRGPFKLFSAPYATGLATIKAIKDRISATRGGVERENAAGDTASTDGSVEASPETKGAEPCLNLTGRFKDGESSPNDGWKAYSKKYRQEHSRQRSERRIDADGLEAFRFELIEVDRAWWRMKVGEIPDVATQVWETLETALPVHLIAQEVQITARECVFWLTVFKRHLDLLEEKQSDRSVYSRTPELGDLSAAVEQKVRLLH